MLLTVADVLALDPVLRGAPVVVVGADWLDAPVRWVHVIELAEAGHLLRGGELVLSTGIALPPDPDGLARYVAGLASAGVSALAVELGSRYVRELPQALVTAATVHRLPLIAFERETQFIAITEAVHAQILDAQVAELRAAQRLHQVFTDLAVAGADAAEIVRQASSLAGAPVILADLAHRVLACASAGQQAEVLLDNFAARSRASVVPGRIGYDQAAGWLAATVVGPAADWGRLIFVLALPPDAGLLVLAERAATTLTLAGLVAGRRRADSSERDAHRSLLAALADPGHVNLADLQARITAVGVPLTGRRLLPVVIRLGGRKADLDPATVVAVAVGSACADLGAPALCGPLGGDRVGALLALPAGASQDAILTRLAAKLRAAGDLGADDVIGIPWQAVPGLAQVRSALREADEAAGAAARLRVGPPGRSWVTLADLGLAGLLHQLRGDPRLLAFAERELGTLLGQDARAGTDLVRVLACYLASGGNKAQAAKRAGLARPTLYQRLSQIEQLLGVSLESADTRLALHAALLARRLSSPHGAQDGFPPGAQDGFPPGAETTAAP